MKFYAINSSPRKNFNTAKILDSFLEGIKSVDENIETERINLYDLKYTGCRECYLCKMKNGKFYGTCAFNDDIKDILYNVSHSDGVVFGSPLFLGELNGQMHSFLERLIYPFKIFEKDKPPVMPPKKLRTAFIYTMNVKPEMMKEYNYPEHLKPTQDWLEFVFGYKPEILYVNNTYQYTDYSRYVADFWDVEDKQKWYYTQFPKDLQTAYEMGRKIVEQVTND